MASPLDAVGPLAIIATLIAANGLFVAAEFAIVGAPKAALEARAAAGDRLARRVLHVLDDPQRQDRFIATAQLGITIASLGLGMYGEHVLARWFELALAGLGAFAPAAAHGAATVLAVATLTYFHIVLGEMVPKSIALQRAEATAIRLAPFMLAVQAACYPLVAGLNQLGYGILRRMGVERRESHGEHILSARELQLVVRESSERGMLRPEASRIVVELFEFGALTAEAAMVPRVAVHGIPAGSDAATLERILHERPHTRYPVYEGDLDHIVGVVHVKQLITCVAADRGLAAGDVRPVPRVAGAATLDAVLAIMRETRTQLAVVMDEHGGTAGVITIEDLFAEVAGEVAEGPEAPPTIVAEPDGRLRVRGAARLEEVGERLGMPLTDDHVDTISGLVLRLLNRPPRVGDALRYEGVELEVTAVAHYGVDECLVRALPRP